MMFKNLLLPIPPGETVKDLLVSRNMSQKEFAYRMDLSEKHICKLLKGEVLLTHDVSIRLEFVFDIPASVWNSLEASYREKLTRIESEKNLDEDIALLDKIPYSFLEENSWISKAECEIQRVSNLRKFFEVTKLSLLFCTVPNVLCKGYHSTVNISDITILSFLQRAKLLAREVESEKLSIRSLKKSFPYILNSKEMASSDAVSNIKALLSRSGIKLIILPAIKEHKELSFIYQDSQQTVVCMTDDNVNSKLFYTTLFTNFAHILLGHLKESNVFTKAMCSEAKVLANNLLIKKVIFDRFIDNQNFSDNSIVDFAIEQCVSPGVVVGMLEDTGYIGKGQFDHLIEKLQ